MDIRFPGKNDVISYIRILILIILVISILFIAVIAAQKTRSDYLTRQSIEYHFHSLHHVGILLKEFYILRDNLKLISIHTLSTSVISDIDHSLFQINLHHKKLQSIHDKFGNESFQGLIDRLQDRFSIYIQPDLTNIVPGQDLDNIMRGLDTIILTLEQLQRLHEQTNTEIIEERGSIVGEDHVFLLVVMGLAFLIGFVLINRIVVAIKRILEEQEKTEEKLFQEKELSQITLESIGDAVITTSNKGLITYMNPVAESLTLWDRDEAIGLPLLKVFNIINEKTGQPSTELVRRVMYEGMVVGLANHTVLISRDNSKRAIEDSAAPIRDRDGNIEGIVVVFQDVTHSRKMAQDMSWQASHDALTHLYNRHKFEEVLRELIGSAKSDSHQHAFLYLDLDQFKIVNDTCGHIAGDELLRQVSTVLKSKVRDVDTVARLGGDEFGILLNSCPIEQASRIANQIRETIQEFRFVWGNKTFTIAVSIGLVPITDTYLNINEIMSMADIACYAAKDIGRNRIHIYEPDDKELSLRRGEMEWVSRIHNAIEENLFILYQQKIVSFTSEDPREEHFEILLRMSGENGEEIPPMAFIPAAERFHLMPQIDRWVIRKVFEKISNLPNEDIRFFSINVSGQSMGDDHFLDFVIEELQQFKLPPEKVCFEITETAAIINFPQALHFINILKEKGCMFALDDFGSGISSFGYLKSLPVNFLKIDGAFIRDILSDEIDHAMVKSINSIGHTMNIYTIAEFVENEGIANELRIIGVDYGQGYGLARPVPL